MIEAVGHEYMEEFFGCCDSLMAEDGLLVLQVIYKTETFLPAYGYPCLILDKIQRLKGEFAVHINTG